MVTLIVKMKCFFVLVAVLVFAYADEGDLDIHRRIVGGRVARRNEYPYQVAIRSRGGALAFCGGTIIANNWVLTAAHCFYNERGYTKTASQVEVVPGTHANLADPITLRFAVPVAKIIVHPGYNTRTKANDICMLKVSGSLIQNQNGIYSEKIDMDMGSVGNMVGLPATVTGYGTMSEGGHPSSQLRTVEVEILDNRKCAVYGVFDTNAMLCAGVHEGGRDSCQGDSGGPLMARGSNGKPVLIGVVSFGGGCARKGLPGVYARVSNYKRELENIMRSN